MKELRITIYFPMAWTSKQQIEWIYEHPIGCWQAAFRDNEVTIFFFV